MIGSREDYVKATTHNEWVTALKHGNLWDLKNLCDGVMILAPASNTDYAYVSAYLEAF